MVSTSKVMLNATRDDFEQLLLMLGANCSACSEKIIFASS